MVKGFIYARSMGFAFFWSLFVTLTLLVYRLMAVSVRGSLSNFFTLSHLGTTSIVILLVIFVLSFVALLVCFPYRQHIGASIYRWRWYLAAIALIALVIANVSGTSIGMWTSQLPDASNAGLILGTVREIRSDEWAIYTPQMLSQFSDSDNLLQHESLISRGTATDMGAFYQAPMWDISQLFRPFQWGFLFLGPERGFSFWWNSRLIFLLMITFEAGMLITGKKKSLAACLALLVAFGPAIQWWFGAGAIVEVVAWGEASLVLGWLFCTTASYTRKTLCALGCMITLGSYLMVLYPSWQLCFGYLFVGLLVAIVVYLKHSGQLVFSAKKDMPLILLSVVLLGMLIGIIIFRSWDALSSLLGSAQGTRSIKPGSLANMADSSFYPLTLVLFYLDGTTTPNPCEAATFYDLFPLGIVLAVAIQLRQRKPDPALVALLCTFALLGVFYYLPIPYESVRQWVLPTVNTQRMLPVLSFINLLLLFRGMAVLTSTEKRPIMNRFKTAAAALTMAIIVTALGTVGQPSFAGAAILIICGAFLAFGVFCFLIANRALILTFSIICATYCGVLVNPIQQGLSVLYENDLVQEIATTTEADPDATWLIANESNFALPQAVLVAGASTLNSVNIYPNADLWSKIDPTGKYADIWNCYGYFDIYLTDEPTSFESIKRDHVKVNLNRNDIEKLGVDYLITRNAETPTTHDSVPVLVDTVGNYYIWKLS